MSPDAPSCAFFGHQAGEKVTTGSGNTCLGRGAGADMVTNTNCTCLGQDSESSSDSVSNEITFGNAYITTLRSNTTSISSLSDRRDKTNIIDLPAGLDFLNTLKPRQFKWDIRDTGADNPHQGTTRAGFIAQELQEAQSGSEYLNLVYDSNPDKLEATQGNLIPVMVQAIKELSAKVKELESKLN